MKIYRLLPLIFLLCPVLLGCQAEIPEESTAPTVIQTQPPTAAHGQWIQDEKGLRYMDEFGIILTGWQTIGTDTYCFLPNGTMLTGWLNDNGNRYYLSAEGKMVTGWQTIDNKRFCFGQDGVLRTGWVEMDGSVRYFGADGSLITGLMNIEGHGYYFDASGARYSGWLTLAQNTYYFDENGIMATGPKTIDGRQYHFSPQGIQILLVNHENPIFADYAPDLVNVTDTDRLDTACADALLQMLEDCRAAGHKPMIVSAYRTQDEQIFLFERKVSTLMEDWDMSRADAEIEAAKHVAIPGTSEHQLGLAIDLVDSTYPYLDDYQATTLTQKWLMAHCHEYGFILRYPNGTTEITGIIFEPWHYRYVGPDIAREIMERGITLEEYLGAA